MPEVVLAVGVLVTAIAGFLFVYPARLAALVDGVFGTRWLYGAALWRLLLGAGLIASAETVTFAPAVAALGWLFVLAGLLLVVIPVQPLRRMAGWFTRLSPAVTRLWLCLALALGLFLLFAALA